VRGRIVPELDDQPVPIEDRLHDAPLDPPSASVNQTDLLQTGFGRRRHVLVDDGRNVPGREAVKIDLGFNRNSAHAFDIRP
jgi:hypothetical protein